jgi:transcriptional regulator with XRE-family HTH domain
MKDILGAQIRAARALLRWAAADLARESGVSLATIHRAESAEGKTSMTFANASAVRRALESAGVELIEENGGGPGARLSQRLSYQLVRRVVEARLVEPTAASPQTSASKATRGKTPANVTKKKR